MKRKTVISVVLIVSIYFALLTLISFMWAPEEVREVGESLVTSTDFEITAKDGYAWINDSGLHFSDPEGTEKIFLAWIDLNEFQKLRVRFIARCPEDFIGTAELHVDLCADGYDADEQEFVIRLKAGENEVDQVLDKGGNAPDKAQLRIFCLDAAWCEITGLSVQRTEAVSRGGKLACAAVAVILSAFLLIVLLTGKKEPAEHSFVSIGKNQNMDYAYAAAIVFLIVLECVFFRSVLGIDSMFGDLGDGRLNNLFVEHWYRFFTGKEQFSDMRIMYPTENTLGFSDCMLGFGIPYSILRMLGVHMYPAFKCILIGCHCYGTIALLHFLHKNLKLNIPSALVGVVVFSFSNYYQLKVGHCQLFAVSLIPGFLILVYKFFESLSKTRLRRIYGVSCVLYLEWMLYTAYYPIFFLMFFILLFTIVVLSVFALRKVNLLGPTLQFIKANRGEVLGYAILGGAVAVPFLKVYLSSMRSFGSRSWGEVSSMLPSALDFVNVSNNNILYGKLFSNFYLTETTCGFPFVTFFFLIAITIFYYNQYIRSSTVLRNNAAQLPDNTKLYVQTALSLSILLLMVLLLSDRGYSLWYFVYLLVPGASAVRAVSRYLLFLGLPAGILLAWFCGGFSEKKSALRKTAVFLLAVFLYVENMTSFQLGGWSSTSQSNFIESVSAPPEDCEIMYLLPDKKQSPYWKYQLDAWEIANMYDLKTINGYSGQLPPELNLTFTMSPGIYTIAVDQWCIRNGLNRGIYAYDEETDVWIPHADVQRALLFDSEMIYLSGAERLEDCIAVHPGGYTFGPYIQMLPGEYKIMIEGDNLNSADIVMHCDMGNTPIECEIVHVDGEMIEVYFTLSTEVSDCEILIANNLEDQDILLDSYEFVHVSPV